jgi:hypothetical protein
MQVIVGFLVLGALALALIGWVAPLVIGIIKLRRRSGGIALTIIGGIWAVGALGLAALGVFAYRQFSAAMRVEAFNPASYHGAMGTITLPYKGESSLVGIMQGSPTRMRLVVREGVAQAPVGAYSALSYEAAARDANGRRWTARCDVGMTRESALIVGTAAPVELDVGPPFTAAVTVAERSGKVDLGFNTSGRGGYSYTIMSSEPPRFEVVDGSGKVLWQGRFEYG